MSNPSDDPEDYIPRLLMACETALAAILAHNREYHAGMSDGLLCEAVRQLREATDRPPDGSDDPEES
jgi:hypothetical protein